MIFITHTHLRILCLLYSSSSSLYCSIGAGAHAHTQTRIVEYYIIREQRPERAAHPSGVYCISRVQLHACITEMFFFCTDNILYIFESRIVQVTASSVAAPRSSFPRGNINRRVTRHLFSSRYVRDKDRRGRLLCVTLFVGYCSRIQYTII